MYSQPRANPQIYFSAEFQKLMTQNHPRGGGIPKAENFDKIRSSTAACRSIRKGLPMPVILLFCLSGLLMKKQSNPCWKNISAVFPPIPQKENYKDLGIRPPSGMIDKVITKGSDPKSYVNLVFTSPAAYNTSDAYALRSLGEVMDIKLVEQLREEKGGVYGVSAFGAMTRIPYSYYTFQHLISLCT